MYKNFLKNKRNIILLIILLVIIFGAAYKKISNNKIKNKAKEIVTVDIQENIGIVKPERNRNYGKVTFFHQLSIKASLSIPEDWEGKYKIISNQNATSFTFIIDPQNQVPIFTVRAHNKNNKIKLNKNEKELKEVDNFIFTYEIFVNNEIKERSSNYSNIINDLEDVLNSFKTFKL